MTNLIEHIQRRTALSDDMRQAVISHFRYEEIPKNEQLVREDQFCRKLFYLEKGTVRTFYYNKEKDVTSWFYAEDQFFTSWYSFLAEQPSYEYIETLEDSAIYFIDRFSYQQLLSDFPAFERFGRLLAEEQLAFIDQYSKGYMFMSAREKYDQLLSIFPDITLRVNLGHIASFLGISQETLSRIRRQA